VSAMAGSSSTIKMLAGVRMRNRCALFNHGFVARRNRKRRRGGEVKMQDLTPFLEKGSGLVF